MHRQIQKVDSEDVKGVIIAKTSQKQRDTQDILLMSLLTALG
jgi:hypothetical protein